jgi:hypothetical protein
MNPYKSTLNSYEFMICQYESFIMIHVNVHMNSYYFEFIHLLSHIQNHEFIGDNMNSYPGRGKPQGLPRFQMTVCSLRLGAEASQGAVTLRLRRDVIYSGSRCHPGLEPTLSLSGHLLGQSD